MSLNSSPAQDRGFERELRRKPGAHLLFGPRRSGLVIENDVAAISVPLDAIGAPGKLKHAVLQRNVDLAGNLGGDCLDAGTPQPLPGGEPMSNAHEPRPPEGAGFREILERREVWLAELDENRRGVVRQGTGVTLREIADRVVNDGAALGGARRHIDRIERR